MLMIKIISLHFHTFLYFKPLNHPLSCLQLEPLNHPLSYPTTSFTFLILPPRCGSLHHPSSCLLTTSLHCHPLLLTVYHQALHSRIFQPDNSPPPFHRILPSQSCSSSRRISANRRSLQSILLSLHPPSTPVSSPSSTAVNHLYHCTVFSGPLNIYHIPSSAAH